MMVGRKNNWFDLIWKVYSSIVLVTRLRTELKCKVIKSGSGHQLSGLRRGRIRVFQTRIYIIELVLVCIDSPANKTKLLASRSFSIYLLISLNLQLGLFCAEPMSLSPPQHYMLIKEVPIEQRLETPRGAQSAKRLSSYTTWTTYWRPESGLQRIQIEN